MSKDIAKLATFESQKEVVCMTHLWNPKKPTRQGLSRSAESAQQRKTWLARQRVRDRAYRALWSAAQRERVLGYRRGRLASETPDQ